MVNTISCSYLMVDVNVDVVVVVVVELFVIRSLVPFVPLKNSAVVTNRISLLF